MIIMQIISSDIIKNSIKNVVSGLAVFCMLIHFGACRRADSGSVSADSLSAEVDTLMPDSIMEEPEDTVALLNLRTTEEILAYISSSPDREKYEEGIIPRMARDVPEYAGKLLDNQEEGFLIVDKFTMKCYRYDRFGRLQEKVGIACAKPYGSKHKRRDNRTPEGYFTIEGIYNSTEWLYTDDDGNTSEQKGQFGPRFMRLRTPVSSQIGIHGTVAPWSIGGRRSHGCIRMTNENILRFAEICKKGWPVIVSPGPKDMAVNESEGYDIPSVAVTPNGKRCTPSSMLDESKPKEASASESEADKDSKEKVSNEHNSELEQNSQSDPQSGKEASAKEKSEEEEAIPDLLN